MNGRPSQRAFTLIEVLVGMAIFTLVVLSSSAAVGAMLRHQQDAYERAKAAALGALIGQWRAMQMSALAYSYYSAMWFNPASPAVKTGISLTEWKSVAPGATPSASSWPEVCPYLERPLYNSVALAWNTTNFVTIPSTTQEAPTAGTPIYLVKLNYTGGTATDGTATTGLPGTSSTPANVDFGGQMALNSWRDIAVTFGGPAGTGDTGWVVMTLWLTNSDIFRSGTTPGGTSVKIPFKFLARFVVPDYFTAY